MICLFILGTKLHPVNLSKPLVNYELALVCLPGIVYGAIVGYILNKLLWDIFIVLGLIYILYGAFIKMKK